MPTTPALVDFELIVHQGKDLAAKDRNIFGKRTTSDPFVEVYWLNKKIGKTKTISKCLSPVWRNETFRITLPAQQVGGSQACFFLKIFDEDEFSQNDPMGTVTVHFDLATLASNETNVTRKWYEVPSSSAKNAKGSLEVTLKVTVQQAREIVRGNAYTVPPKRVLVGLAWDMINQGNRMLEVDLDASCVAVSMNGTISMPDCVYYANLMNSNQSVIHSGDEREGDEAGDDETIMFELDHIPSHVLAMYIILNVATPNMTFADVRTTKVRILDSIQNFVLCAFRPAQHKLSADATAMFLVRIARQYAPDGSYSWAISPIEDTHPSARDFGSLIPYVKSYTQDLIPSIAVDPTERVAILRKGGNIRLRDYCPDNSIPKFLTFGLAWDVTDGINIDLDASLVCLDSNIKFVDAVWYRQLESKDGSMKHFGDEREGDEVGDDEKIGIALQNVNPDIHYIGLIINSYSGQELDDVNRASCHLFDPLTGHDMATYAMTNCQALDRHTALILGCLYRCQNLPGEWGFCIIAEPGNGRVVLENVKQFQKYLLKHKPTAPNIGVEEEEIVIDSMMPSPVPFQDEDIDLSQPVGRVDGEIDLSRP